LGLGVGEGHFENLLYIPLAFACWMSPVTGIIYGWLGWFSPRASEREKERWHERGEAIQTFDDDHESLAGLKPIPAANSRCAAHEDGAGHPAGWPAPPLDGDFMCRQESHTWMKKPREASAASTAG
jgi:hypothetical protein